MIMNIKTITAIMITMIKRWYKSMSVTTTTLTTHINRIKSTIMKNIIQVRSINQINYVIRIRILMSIIFY